MINNFGKSSGDGKMQITIESLEKPSDKQAELLVNFGNEGLVCPICGGPAKRTGNCSIVCSSCNTVTRSGCGE